MNVSTKYSDIENVWHPPSPTKKKKKSKEKVDKTSIWSVRLHQYM